MEGRESKSWVFTFFSVLEIYLVYCRMCIRIIVLHNLLSLLFYVLATSKVISGESDENIKLIEPRYWCTYRTYGRKMFFVVEVGGVFFLS